jgi:hypothetical protein
MNDAIHAQSKTKKSLQRQLTNKSESPILRCPKTKRQEQNATQEDLRRKWRFKEAKTIRKTGIPSQTTIHNQIALQIALHQIALQIAAVIRFRQSQALQIVGHQFLCCPPSWIVSLGLHQVDLWTAARSPLQVVIQVAHRNAGSCEEEESKRMRRRAISCNSCACSKPTRRRLDGNVCLYTQTHILTLVYDTNTGRIRTYGWGSSFVLCV